MPQIIPPAPQPIQASVAEYQDKTLMLIKGEILETLTSRSTRPSTHPSTIDISIKTDAFTQKALNKIAEVTCREDLIRIIDKIYEDGYSDGVNEV